MIYVHCLIARFQEIVLFISQCKSQKPVQGDMMLQVGCNNGGAGGNCSKVKRLVAKWIGTQKRLLVVLHHGWDFRIAETFSKGIFYPQTHICIFAPVGSWNMQEHWNMQEYSSWNSDTFWFGGGRICGGYSPFFVLADLNLPLFLLHLRLGTEDLF